MIAELRFTVTEFKNVTLKDRGKYMVDREIITSSLPLVEDIVEKKLEEIVTILASNESGKSYLYFEVLSIIERVLIRIALRRSNNIKTAAASFLGISRNTLHNKMVKLKIKNNEK